MGNRPEWLVLGAPLWVVVHAHTCSSDKLRLVRVNSTVAGVHHQQELSQKVKQRQKVGEEKIEERKSGLSCPGNNGRDSGARASKQLGPHNLFWGLRCPGTTKGFQVTFQRIRKKAKVPRESDD